jgi:hypothetical protein
LENSLVDSNIIKLIEETVKDDQELEKELNIFDVCQQKKGRVLSKDMYINSQTDTVIDPDSCETAAQVFKCGVESDSKAMTDLVTDSSKILAQQSMVVSSRFCLQQL